MSYEDIGSHGQNYEYKTSQPQTEADLDPFYDEVPPGGEYVVQSGEALPPQPLRETAEEADARRSGLREAFKEILRGHRQ